MSYMECQKGTHRSKTLSAWPQCACPGWRGLVNSRHSPVISRQQALTNRIFNAPSWRGRRASQGSAGTQLHPFYKLTSMPANIYPFMFSPHQIQKPQGELGNWNLVRERNSSSLIRLPQGRALPWQFGSAVDEPPHRWTTVASYFPLGDQVQGWVPGPAPL